MAQKAAADGTEKESRLSDAGAAVKDGIIASLKGLNDIEGEIVPAFCVGRRRHQGRLIHIRVRTDSICHEGEVVEVRSTEETCRHPRQERTRDYVNGRYG